MKLGLATVCAGVLSATGFGVSGAYGNNRSVLPYTVLSGRDGRILAQHFGSFSEQALEDWLTPHL